MKSRVLLAIVLGGLLCAGLSAAPVLLGTFSIAGNITVTNPGQAGCPPGVACINWTDPPALNADKADIAAAGLTGVFAGIVGFAGNDAANIIDLHNPPEIVGSPGFPPQLLISFNNGGVTTTLLINFIDAGVDGVAQCGLAPAAGQICTPSGSLFNLQNISASQSSASWVVEGVTNDGQSKFVGNFTSQFNVPFQSVLGQLTANGFVQNSYSATFTLTAIPEPGPTVLMGLGLGLLAISVGMGRRRKV